MASPKTQELGAKDEFPLLRRGEERHRAVTCSVCLMQVCRCLCLEQLHPIDANSSFV